MAAEGDFDVVDVVQKEVKVQDAKDKALMAEESDDKYICVFVACI